MTSKVDFMWRFVLLLMVGVPLVLSVAYKSSYGGEASRNIKASQYVDTTTTSSYGMFAPPGMQFLGAKTSVSLFFNAMLPFMGETQAPDITNPPWPEPEIPKRQQGYGFNVLMLHNESTAILDMPESSYLSAVQPELGDRQTWKMSGDVIGTVAKLDITQRTNTDAFNDTLMEECHPATVGSGSWNYAALKTGTNVVMMNNFFIGDSYQYVALLPATGIGGLDTPCS